MASKTVAQALALQLAREDKQSAAIMQDLPYVLQGLGTSLLPFSGGALQLPSDLSPSLAGFLHRLFEPAVVYCELQRLLRTPVCPGYVMIALQVRITEKLQNYLVLVGEIERRIKSGDVSFNFTMCWSLLREPTRMLRLLHSLLLECHSRQLVGGQVLSLLHEYTWHGDAFVSSLASDLLAEISEPFNDIQHLWMTAGSLKDPHGEFFVGLHNPESPWVDRFKFLPHRIPSSMSESEARHIFEVGKALYFSRVLCQEDVTEFALANPSSQAASATERNARVLEHVSSALLVKYRLVTHLETLKNYMLLAKGDFVESLLVEAWMSLQIPARRVMHHTLLDVLSGAIETSNAKFEDPEVLGLLDASILDKGSDREAWDVFTLEYRVGSPLDVIVDGWAYRDYLRLFNTLWNLRWAAYCLGQSWRQFKESMRRDSPRAGHPVWFIVENAHQDVLHLFNELLGNAYYHVLEPAWCQLQSEMPTTRIVTVDGVRTAHQRYLHEIVTGIQLGGSPVVTSALYKLVDVALALRDAVEQLRRVDESDDADSSKLSALEERVVVYHSTFGTVLGTILTELRDHENESLRKLAARL